MSTRYPFLLARCIAATLAFWAVSKHSYDFYVLTRWVLCITCVWGLVLCRRRPWPSFAPAYAIIGILFNPVMPFHFARTTWHKIDIAAGVVLLVTLPFTNPFSSNA